MHCGTGSGVDGDPALSRVEAFLMVVKLVASLTEFGDRAYLFLGDLPATIVREDGIDHRVCGRLSVAAGRAVVQCEGHGDLLRSGSFSVAPGGFVAGGFRRLSWLDLLLVHC